MSGTWTQGVAAAGFLVMEFTDETAGDEALKAMEAAKGQHHSTPSFWFFYARSLPSLAAR